MLILEAEIRFDRHEENNECLPNDLSTEHVIRPSIGFGNGMLFSGTIKADKKIKILERGEEYNVMIEMPTIEDEAHEEIKHLICVDSKFEIHVASKIVGRGKVVNFIYE